MMGSRDRSTTNCLDAQVTYPFEGFRGVILRFLDTVGMSLDGHVATGVVLSLLTFIFTDLLVSDSILRLT